MFTFTRSTLLRLLLIALLLAMLAVPVLGAASDNYLADRDAHFSQVTIPYVEPAAVIASCQNGSANNCGGG
jgi:hypothetical protein